MGLSPRANPGHDFSRRRDPAAGRQNGPGNATRKVESGGRCGAVAPAEPSALRARRSGRLPDARSPCSATPRSSRARMIEGLTQTQFAALAKLYEVGPCSQNQLGRLIVSRRRHHQGRGRSPGRARLRARARRSAGPPPPRRRPDRARPPGHRGREQVAADITAATLKPLSAEEQRQVTRLLKKLG